MSRSLFSRSLGGVLARPLSSAPADKNHAATHVTTWYHAMLETPRFVWSAAVITRSTACACVTLPNGSKWRTGLDIILHDSLWTPRPFIEVGFIFRAEVSFRLLPSTATWVKDFVRKTAGLRTCAPRVCLHAAAISLCIQENTAGTYKNCLELGLCGLAERTGSIMAHLLGGGGGMVAISIV